MSDQRHGGPAPLGEHLQRVLALSKRIGDPTVDTCEECGGPSDRLLCRTCHAEREERHLANLAQFDADFRKVVRHAKETGALSAGDKAWLLRHSCKDTVEALEARFKREDEKRGGRPAKSKAEAVGFGTRRQS